MANESERRIILEMIDNGKITAEEGLQLLQALPEEESEWEASDSDAALPAPSNALVDAPASPTQPPPPSSDTGAQTLVEETGETLVGEVDQASKTPDFNRWRSYWLIPLWIGVGVTVLGSMLMYWAQQSSGVSFWFFCAGVPFALGVILIMLAWQSRTARWLHLRVQQREGEWPKNIAFSFPLPLRATGWFMRTFGARIPGMENTSIDEVLQALENSTSADAPLIVDVDEGEDGERVQIYIG